MFLSYGVLILLDLLSGSNLDLRQRVLSKDFDDNSVAIEKVHCNIRESHTKNHL